MKIPETITVSLLMRSKELKKVELKKTTTEKGESWRIKEIEMNQNNF